MNYPLITDYIDSIRFAENNFATLTNLRPIFKNDDNPLYIIEGSSIVFKMEDIVLEKLYWVKCFLSEQLNRKDWYNEICQSGMFFSKDSLFLEKELFVDTDVTNNEEFPVFIYPCTENVCLADYIYANIENKHALAHLSNQFGQILKWSRDSSFVWNKLDMSKMVVNSEGYLEFIGLDDILLKSTEDTEIHQSDEVSIVMLLLSLKAIAIMPELFDSNKIKSHLLFAIQDGEHIVKSDIFQKLIHINDKEINSLIGYLLLCLNYNSFTRIDSNIFSLKPVFESEIDELLYYAKNGDDKKQIELARLYIKQKSYAEAYKWYEAAARQGNPDGINGVGCCYKNGFAVDKNEEYAVQLFAKAADKGSERAQYNLAMAYYSGKGIDLDWEKAYFLFKKLAENGEPNSQYMVGKYHMINQLGSISWHLVSKRDTKIAFTWFEKSAKQGHSRAQYQLGMFYESGTDPCLRNIEKALSWYEKAADQGCNDAIFALGRLYTNGIDEKNPDMARAFQYFLKAAKAGHAEAQYRVGVSLYYGKGTEIDKESAVLWLEKSASQRNEPAENLLIQLKSECAEVENNNTAATQGEMANAKMDSYGVLYSADGKKLLHYGIDDVSNDWNFNSIKQQSLKKYSVPEGVTIICDDAFSDCESLETIILPSSLKLIGSSAFYNCVNLESIVIPEGVKSIESFTFNGCTSLQDLVLPHSLVKIVPGALTGVRSIESVSPYFAVKDGCLFSSDYKTLIYFFNNERYFFEIPYGTICIGDNAFEDSSIKSIIIVNSVTAIGESSFSGCENLYEISFPSTITKIGAGAFAGCRNLLDVKLPPHLKCIDVQAFDSCRNLTHVLIPNNIEEIGNMAFMSTNLSSVSLPQNLKKIGGMAFAGAPLASINSKSSRFKVDDMTIYSIDGKELVQYYGHDSMFEIPETVVKIADFAFAFAYTLREIVIPDSIKEIGKSFLLEISPDKIYVASERLKSMVIERTPSWSHINIIVEKS
jgi:TPR repeat protein